MRKVYIFHKILSIMHHQFNIHLPNFGLKRELSEIYFAIVLRAIALSMLGLFIPLYLFKEINLGLTNIVYYYLLWAVVFAVTSFIAMKFACKYGFKHCIFVSAPLDILALGLFYLLGKGYFPFWVPAIFVGIANAFFWSGFHVNFAKSSDKVKRGREVGFMYALIALFAVLGPFVGSVILTNFGFYALFGVVSVLLLIGVFPLILSEDGHDEINFRFKDVLRVFNFRDMFAFIGVGMRYMIILVFWPLFVFLTLGTYLSLGIIATISTLIGAVFTFFVGKICDKYDKRVLTRIGAFIHGIVFFFRGTVVGFISVLFVDTLSALSGTLGDVATDARFYDKANEISRPAYVVFRECSLTIGRVLVLLCILITGAIASSFILGGLGSLLWMLY